jgi:hypothetical protein
MPPAKDSFLRIFRHLIRSGRLTLLGQGDLEAQLEASLAAIPHCANDLEKETTMRSVGKPTVGTAPASDAIEGEFVEQDSQVLATVHRAGAPLMHQRTQYATAMQVVRPRDLNALTNRILEEAQLSGDDFYFSWTVRTKDGEKIVEGPTIDAAMIMSRNFGNCVAESSVAEEGPVHWLLDAVFVDLETGYTLRRQFRQRKGEAHQKKGGDPDRLLDMAFQIGQSKAQRNVILKAMPAWLVNKAMDTAKTAAEANYKERLPEAIENAKAGYAALGVTLAELEKKVNKPSAAWAPGDVRLLQAIYRGILARETSIESEFHAPAEEPQAHAAAPLMGAPQAPQSVQQPQPTEPATPAAPTPPAATQAPAPLPPQAGAQASLLGAEPTGRPRRTRQPGED